MNGFNSLINSRFKRLIQKIAKLPEVRRQKSYQIQDIFGGALALFILKCGSRNCYNTLRDNPAFRENYENCFGSKLPHGDSIEKVLRSFDPKKLEDLKAEEAARLIRRKTFTAHLLHGEYYTIAIDATGICSYKKRHCPYCLHKTSKKGKTTYFHYVLEAKLVTPVGHAISIASEFIENPEGEEYEKQDCELNAFKRLAKKLKGYFPRLRMCLLLDGLYPNKSVFGICKQNKWAFIINLPEKSLKSFQMKVNRAGLNTGQHESKVGKWAVQRDYKYANGLTYKKEQYAYIECVEHRSHPDDGIEDSTKKFVFITNLQQDAWSIEITIARGRIRWKIENEGFNIQKNNGYALKHKYSRANYKAMQNYYHLMQLAHMINQFAIQAPKVKQLFLDNPKYTQLALWDDLKSVLSIIVLKPLPTPLE